MTNSDYAEFLGQRGRRLHEKVRALDQQQQARSKQQHLGQHAAILAYRAWRSHLRQIPF